MVSDTLSSKLQQAVPNPGFLSSTDGGAILSLALHSLMIDSGFAVLDHSGRQRHSKFQPSPNWNGQFPDQWVFEYTKPCKANKFILHCSLQKTTNRLFIHASEDNNIKNVQIMGLLLDNYVSSPQKLSSESWEDVVSKEADLSSMFQQYIVGPLNENSEDLPVNFYNDSASVTPPTGSEPAQNAWLSNTTIYVAGGVALSAIILGSTYFLLKRRYL